MHIVISIPVLIVLEMRCHESLVSRPGANRPRKS